MKSIKSIYNKQTKSYKFEGIWADIFGEPEVSGAWLIWGEEKNGKTWFALMLSNMLSLIARTLYISAEEGLGKDFRECMLRAGLSTQNKNLKLEEYIPLTELEERLQSRKAPKIVIIDNLTIYNEEMKYGRFRELLSNNQNKLFIFIAHEEKKQPYTGTAKLCSRLAKVIVHVQGLKAKVSGRCPGGEIVIDDTKAQLCWGAKRF